MEKRIEWLDIAKSIGIFLVVIGHTGVNSAVPYVSQWIYSFHMPLFYFISGMLFKEDKYSSDLGLFIRSRLKSLVLPFVCFNTLVYLICYNVDSLPGLQYVPSQLITGCGALYFIRVLFVTEVWYVIIYKLARKKNILVLFFIVFILALCDLFREINSADLSRQLSSEVLNWGMLFPCLPLFYYGMGNLLKSKILSLDINFWGIITLCSFVASVLILCVDLNGYARILPAFIGIVFIFSLSIVFQNRKYLTLQGGVTYIGRNTFVIVALHGFLYNIMKLPLQYLNLPRLFDVGVRFILLWILLILFISLINKYTPWMVGKFKK